MFLAFNEQIKNKTMNNLQQDLAKLDEALKLNPRSPEAWYNKGRALLDSGKYQEALESFDKALEINQKYAEAWYFKGTALGLNGRYQEALVCFEKAIEIDPKSVESWRSKGSLLLVLGRYQEALTSLEKALEINPRDVETWNSKGNTLAGLGRYQEVLTCFDKALEIDPEYAMAWYNKGKALVDVSLTEIYWEQVMNRCQEAIHALHKFIEIAPSQYASDIEYAKNLILELELKLNSEPTLEFEPKSKPTPPIPKFYFIREQWKLLMLIGSIVIIAVLIFGLVAVLRTILLLASLILFAISFLSWNTPSPPYDDSNPVIALFRFNVIGLYDNLYSCIAMAFGLFLLILYITIG